MPFLVILSCALNKKSFSSISTRSNDANLTILSSTDNLFKTNFSLKSASVTIANLSSFLTSKELDLCSFICFTASYIESDSSTINGF